MTYKEIYQLLLTIGIPVGYYSYPIGSVPDLPYIVYYYPGRDDDAADNINWGRIANLNIELYTADKDFAMEETVETVLTGAGLFYDKTESYIDSERMYQILYEMEVAICESDTESATVITQ